MVGEDLSKRFGKLLREAVKAPARKRGCSQEEVSFRGRLRQAYVSSVERGERNVTIGTDDRMARTSRTSLAETFAKL